mgnify:CR=1 FL=1
MQVLFWILSLVIGYFLGTLNGALLISRAMMHDDVRTHGSGNAGLTNFFRTYGGFQSLLVVAIDMLKCILACQIAAWLLPDQALHAKLAAGLACILGHSYPVTENFRGGKGILCGSAVGLMISPKIYAIIMTVFFVVVIVTRYVSLGSVLAAASFVVCVLGFYWGDWITCILAAATGGFVIWRHRANLSRLVHGTESKLTFHKK